MSEIKSAPATIPRWLPPAAVALTLVFVASYLWWSTAQQRAAYDDLAGFIKQRHLSGDVGEGNLLRFMSVVLPAQDVIGFRGATIFLGFVVALIGCLFVLSGARGSYELRAQATDGKGTSLRTSSPGLVLITLGLVAALTALYRNVEFNLGFIDRVPVATPMAEVPSLGELPPPGEAAPVPSLPALPPP